jgi:hypothetical protein
VKYSKEQKTQALKTICTLLKGDFKSSKVSHPHRDYSLLRSTNTPLNSKQVSVLLKSKSFTVLVRDSSEADFIEAHKDIGETTSIKLLR